MAQFTRLEVAQTMKDTGMIPLFFHNDIELSKKVLKACYDGGARLMEFTARGDFAHEVFGELTKYARSSVGPNKNRSRRSMTKAETTKNA